MKKLPNFRLAAAAACLALASAVSARAGDVNVTIENASGETITLDAVSCTGCTSSSTTSIPSSSSDVSSADATPSATSMTYSFSYSAYFDQGTQQVEKGCRGTITLNVSDGEVAKVVTSSWKSYTGPATCTTNSAPQFNIKGQIDWEVRLNAS